ncbi:MAG TPA: hypothetical protein VF126_12740 [Acidobacteriaceae bacterium]
MLDLPKVMRKKTWFLLFNCVTIVYLIISGALKWNPVSLFSYAVALSLINCIALISARKYYKDWK